VYPCRDPRASSKFSFAGLRASLLLLVLLAALPGLGLILYASISRGAALAGASRILFHNLAGIGLVGMLVFLTAWMGADLFVRRRVKALLEAQLDRQREALYQSEKVAIMGELLAGVAHELNNPLSVVTGRAALLCQAAGEGPFAEQAAKIAQAAERCARIVRNFLAIARQYPPERQQVQLNQVVEEAVELLAYPLRVDSVKVTLDLAPDLPILWADAHQLRQVVVNLITNAHHAMRGSPRRGLALVTRLDPERGRVSLAVADTGPGIPPEIQPRIFEPFFTTKPVGQGTGLGLSISRGIIESHGGSIRVESQFGEGAVLIIELPVEAGPEAAQGADEIDAMLPVPGKTILVVDDEPEVAEMLVDMLVAEGHHVEAVLDGARALDKLQEQTYDLILSDLRMPELDGPGLYRELERRDPRLCRRFIFLTGDTLSPAITQFLEATGTPSLSKPFTPDKVRSVVQRALRGLRSRDLRNATGDPSHAADRRRRDPAQAA